MTSESGQRQRQRATRSRMGCLTCRHRHVRCDEKRPACTNCISGSRQCHYQPAPIPLRDRRQAGKAMLPGEQTPWIAMQHQWETNRVPTIQPYGVLPIKLSPRARELIHCFDAAGGELGVDPRFIQEEQRLTHTAIDDYALRCKLLVAGLHFAWGPNPLPRWEQTVLQHKGESLRAINEWLQKPHKDRARAVVLLRQIAVQCLLEICVGNVSAAEAHIDGYLTFRDVQERQGLGTDDEESALDEELADRYLFLTSEFLAQVKSRLTSASILTPDAPPSTPSPSAAAHLKKWHGTQHGFMDGKIRAMWLLSHFFAAPPRTPHTIPTCPPIDARPVLMGARMVTDAADRAHYGAEDAMDDPEYVWRMGGPSRMLLAFVGAHVLSFCEGMEKQRGGSASASGGDGEGEDDGDGEEEGEMVRVKWSALMAAIAMYTHAVLDSSNAGAAIDVRLLRRMVAGVKRDIEGMGVSDPDGQEEDDQSDFWFWEVFVATAALEKSKQQSGGWGGDERASAGARSRTGTPNTGSSQDGSGLGDELASLLEWCRTRIRAWSGQHGDWAVARERLSRVVWPEVTVQESVLSDVWRRALAGEAED